MFSTSNPESIKFSSVALVFIFLMICSNGFSAFLMHKISQYIFFLFLTLRNRKFSSRVTLVNLNSHRYIKPDSIHRLKNKVCF